MEQTFGSIALAVRMPGQMMDFQQTSQPTNVMKPALLFLAAAALHAEEPKRFFEKVITQTHNDVIVERYRASEGTEQIWLVSTAEPARRHLLYTHHRQAEMIFSDDDGWLAINDHFGSAGSSLRLYRRKATPVYEPVTDLTQAAWRYFDEHNGLKIPAKGKSADVQSYDKRVGLEANPFDHRYIDAVCWAGEEPPTLLIRLSGHLSGPAGLISGSSGWYCLYDLRTKSFSTDLNTLNKKNTKLETK